jgi:hypothetical protein
MSYNDIQSTAFHENRYIISKLKKRDAHRQHGDLVSEHSLSRKENRLTWNLQTGELP